MRKSTNYIIRRKNGENTEMPNLTMEKKICCPVCGQTLVSEYDICNVCNWENDPVQLWKPDFSGGANEVSLNQARELYKKKCSIRQNS